MGRSSVKAVSVFIPLRKMLVGKVVVRVAVVSRRKDSNKLEPMVTSGWSGASITSKSMVWTLRRLVHLRLAHCK
jgi:hypothetical protein